MNCTIRAMRKEDKPHVLEMMRTFYASPAVFSNGSEEIFSNDIDNCIGANPYIEGYVFEDAQILRGYAMVAKSYSTEFGKTCIWIEDLYIQEACRGSGLGTAFFEFLTGRYSDCIFRLEVEEDNAPAVHLYKKCGFTVLPYLEMKK